MADTVYNKITAEFEQKRRKASQVALEFKTLTYKKYPTLADFDRQISNTATEYTKRIIGGEDVKEEMRKNLSVLFEKKKRFLADNGIDITDFDPQYECKVCNDTGRTERGVCECFNRRVIEENFASSNIGDSLSHQSFDSFDFNFYPDTNTEGYPQSPRDNMKRNYSFCKAFSDNFDTVKKSLLLIGGTGLGKTFLSTCVAKQLLNNGKSVIYISAVDFFKRIEKSRFDSENKDVELFENCDLLIIDDLGTEAPSVYTTAVFSDILDKRLRCNKKMILSSNNKLSEFENIYGERVFSRLAGCFECLLFYGKDIRIQKFMNKAD